MGRNQGHSQLVLTNTPLDKPRYIFTDPWTVADDLAIGTATLKTTDWQIKGSGLWKQIIAADQTVWVTDIDAQNKGNSLMRELDHHCRSLDPSSYLI